MRFNKEALQRYMKFAASSEALWRGSFRDLSASVVRMATLTKGGRISTEIVEAEIARLKQQWGTSQPSFDSPIEKLLSVEKLNRIDLFDRLAPPCHPQASRGVAVCGFSMLVASALPAFDAAEINAANMHFLHKQSLD